MCAACPNLETGADVDCADHTGVEEIPYSNQPLYVQYLVLCGLLITVAPAIARTIRLPSPSRIVSLQDATSWKDNHGDSSHSSCRRSNPKSSLVNHGNTS